VLLDGKTAVVYGAAGSVGGAVARAFAGEGARVFLAGRTRETLDEVAEEIRAGGGSASTAVVDALDAKAVDEHADAVAAEAGGLDISLNAITHPSEHGKPIAEMELEDFTNEVLVAVSSTFLTARAAARHMIPRKSGVILIFGGTGPPLRNYYIGGTQVALGAIDLMRRQLAAELGPHGIRAVTLRTGGIPDSIPETSAARAEIENMIVSDTMLGRAATLEDVGNVAAFVASDRARTMTAATANISCGALVD
jgi:NAD(P)-dependent dehydrogenase (short-subunit alcohol dehydrogenase family)